MICNMTVQNDSNNIHHTRTVGDCDVRLLQMMWWHYHWVVLDGVAPHPALLLPHIGPRHGVGH